MSSRSRALSIVALLILVLTGYGAPATSGASPSRQATFISTSCPFKVGGGAFKPVDVRCGFLVVPENRQVDDSHSIKLAVAVFRARGSHPAPYPLIYLAGGPGVWVVDPMGSAIASGRMPAYVGNRDLILIDQRGLGLSQPALTCSEATTAYTRALNRHLTSDQWARLARSALRACRSRMVRKGIHLAAYNTIENAADIAALGPALGYKRVDLFGGSYGSYLAQQVLRDHPQGVRSVVMEAIVVPPFNAFNDEIPNTWRSLQLIFKTCAASRTCNAKYPHLKQSLINVMTRLQVHPATLHISVPGSNGTHAVKLDAQELFSTMQSALLFQQFVAGMPKFISDTAKGKYGPVTQLEEAFGWQGISPYIGMSLSMTCNAMQAGASPSTVAARAKAVPAAFRSAAVAKATNMLAACAIWHVPSAPAGTHSYFHSAIPTLLLPGAYDPIVSPQQALTLARYYSHSYAVYFPTLTHNIVGTDSCPDSIVGAFLAHPNRKPNTGCASQLTMKWQ